MKNPQRNKEKSPAAPRIEPAPAEAPAPRSARWRLVTALLAALLAVGGWRSINYVSGTRPGVDSGIFLSGGYHMHKGKALYRDVWDHKPPGVFLINYMALSFGDLNAVRTLERLLAVAAVLGIYFLVLWLFGQRWIAFLTGALFLMTFYHQGIFAKGNLTEEYGSMFLLGGMAAAIVAVQRGPFSAMALAAASGAAMSAAALTKEPFVLTALPWFAYLAWPFERRWKPAAMRAAAFLAGAAIPAALVAWFLTANGVWPDFLDGIAFNLLATRKVAMGVGEKLETALLVLKIRTAGNVAMIAVLPVLGLACLFDWRLVRQNRGAIVPVAACAVMGIVAASLNDRYTPHYYMQVVPPLVLLSAFALAHLEDLTRTVPVGRRTLAAMGLCALLLMDVPALWDMTSRMAAPSRQFTGDAFSRYIVENTKPGDFVYAPSCPAYYLLTNRPCPIRLHFMFSHLFADTPASAGEQKHSKFLRQIAGNPPKMIYLDQPNGTDAFQEVGLWQWLMNNYTVALSSPDKTELLFVHRRAMPRPSAGGP